MSSCSLGRNCSKLLASISSSPVILPWIPAPTPLPTCSPVPSSHCSHQSPTGWWHTEQVAQGGCECSIPGGIQCQAGWGPAQTDLVSNNPAHGRRVELVDLQGAFQPKPFSDSLIPWYYDSITRQKNMLSAKNLAWRAGLISFHLENRVSKVCICGSGRKCPASCPKKGLKAAVLTVRGGEWYLVTKGQPWK